MSAAAENLDLRQRHAHRPRPGQMRQSGKSGGSWRAHAARPWTSPRSRCRRAGACRACRRARSSPRRSPPGRRASSPTSAWAISSVHVADRAAHVEAAEGRARRRAGRPPRPSRSTRRPARSRGRRRRSPSVTSTSTVGRPARIPDPAAAHTQMVVSVMQDLLRPVDVECRR